MIIIGEKLNSSIPKTFEAMEKNDMDYLVALIKNQAMCGADFLDINTATLGEKEGEMLAELIKSVLDNTNCGIMIDSPNTDVIKKVVPCISSHECIINSVTINERFDQIVPYFKNSNIAFVGLPIDGKLPVDLKNRKENIEKLISKFDSFGISHERIYIDILVQSVATGDDNAKIALETIKYIKENHFGVKTVCGLSNVSFGLPKRVGINAAFLSVAAFYGLDSAIMDITNHTIKSTLVCIDTISGKDEYCMDYITYVRENE